MHQGDVFLKILTGLERQFTNKSQCWMVLVYFEGIQNPFQLQLRQFFFVFHGCIIGYWMADTNFDHPKMVQDMARRGAHQRCLCATLRA